MTLKSPPARRGAEGRFGFSGREKGLGLGLFLLLRHLTGGEVLLDFLQGTALRLREEEGSRDEVDDRAAGQREEDAGVTAGTHPGQEHAGDGRGHAPVDEQSNGHTINADAVGHQLRESRQHRGRPFSVHGSHRYHGGAELCKGGERLHTAVLIGSEKLLTAE